jgi:hypothetical protein
MGAWRPVALSALAALGLAFFPPGQSAQSQADSGRVGSSDRSAASASIVRAQLDEARRAASLGDWSGASAFLAEAVARDQGDADVQYLLALSSVKRKEPLAEALGSLDAALASGRFFYYSKRDVSLLKAEVLVRERRWKEALDALGGASADAGADPAYRIIRARALAGLGDWPDFLSELAIGLRRYPDAVALPRLFLERAASLPASPAARELADLILGRMSRYVASDPELPLLAAPLMGELQARIEATLAFRASGGSSATATLRALEYGLIDEAAASAELLSGSYAFSLADLNSLFALAGSPAGREAVRAAFSAWAGRVSVDSDRDGIAEASFSMDRGLIGDWEMDSKQAGRIDMRISFSEGLPTEARLLRGGLEIDALYAGYPKLASMSFVEASRKRIYSFAPEALSYAPLALRLFAGSGRTAVYLPYPAPADEPGERACAAAALSLEVEEGGRRTLVVLDKGLPLRATTYEGGRILSITSYSRGLPLLERIDADGDGRFESEKTFTGKAGSGQDDSVLRTDADGDGVYEYSEQSSFPFRKEWDFDGDGSVDAVQYLQRDGSTVQEFSSRVDGRLDERLVLKAGRILSFSREGRPLALLPDSNPALMWIGEKSFDLGRNLPEGEGIFTAMGKRYRLTRAGDLAFAELLP